MRILIVFVYCFSITFVSQILYYGCGKIGLTPDLLESIPKTFVACLIQASILWIIGCFLVGQYLKRDTIIFLKPIAWLLIFITIVSISLSYFSGSGSFAQGDCSLVINGERTESGVLIRNYLSLFKLVALALSVIALQKLRRD